MAEQLALSHLGDPNLCANGLNVSGDVLEVLGHCLAEFRQERVRNFLFFEHLLEELVEFVGTFCCVRHREQALAECNTRWTLEPELLRIGA